MSDANLTPFKLGDAVTWRHPDAGVTRKPMRVIGVRPGFVKVVVGTNYSGGAEVPSNQLKLIEGSR